MNIKQIRYTNARRLVSQSGGITAFANKIDKSQSQASQIAGENPIKGIGDKVAKQIEQAFGLPVGWLDRSPESATAENQNDVPLVSWVQAGDFCEAVEPPQATEDAEWFPRMKNHGPRTYCLRVKGDSMTNPVPGQKTYPEGVIIYVDPDAEVLPGKTVIARLPESNEATLKVFVQDAGTGYLKPLNPQYQMMPLPEGSTFCGVVVGAYWQE